MKKITLGLLLVVVGLIFMPNVKVEAKDCFLVNNNGICISEDEYNNLLNLAFTESEIMNMDEDVFQDNKDLIGHVVSVTTNYYKDTNYYYNGEVISNSELVSEDEYNLITADAFKRPINITGVRSVANGYTETTGKRMDTYIIEMSGYLRYKVTLNWKVMPVKRSYDIIGLGLEGEKVYVSSNPIFSQHYCTTSGSCTTTNSATVKTFEGGVGATFKLPEGSMSEMSSYLYYNVAKGVNYTLTELHAYGDYSHATSNVTQSQGSNYYTVGTGGIYLYSEVSGYYDSIAYAMSTWYGSW